MREGPNHSKLYGLATAAAAALLVAACADQPTSVPGVTGPQESFQVVETQSGESVVAGRVLVKFKDQDQGLQIASARGLDMRQLARGLNIMDVEVGREVEKARELAQDPAVEWAEPDYVRALYAPPNDQYFGYKWGLHNDGTLNTSTGDFVANTGAVDADIDWLEAYEHLAGASFQSARIAILDTGIRQDHEDLGHRVVGQYDFFDDDSDASDDHGHGSHTAGIAAADGNNGVGVPGVAWHGQIGILVAKVCGPTGMGPFAAYGCPTSGTALAIRWAADNGARAINLSLGGASGSSAEQDALQYALDRETLAFCASGNDDGVVSYPAAFPECVAVGATDWGDDRASYSNFGPQVEVSAPGGDTEHADGYSYILSAYFDAANSYAFMAGTSMAAPMAAGLGGLLASMGVATASEVRSIMTSTADDLGASGRDDEFGHGRINAHAAVLAVDGGGGEDPPPEENQAPTAAFTFSCSDLSCSFDGSGSSDPDGDALSYSWTFGDGGTATGQTADHSYASEGTYSVTLTVSDGELSDDQSQNVSVTEPPTSGGIELSANGYKTRGQHTIDLTWSGAGSTNVDIFRNGSLLTTTANDGAHTDATSNRGGGSYTYQVCEAGTSTCSSTVTVNF